MTTDVTTRGIAQIFIKVDGRPVADRLLDDLARATVESSFQRESGVGGFLESQGEFTRSVNFMTKLLQEYPPEPYVAAATYALAQRVYAKAPEAAGDGKLPGQKVHRVALVRHAFGEGLRTAVVRGPPVHHASVVIRC